jgi:hypothetical protein
MTQSSDQQRLGEALGDVAQGRSVARLELRCGRQGELEVTRPELGRLILVGSESVIDSHTNSEVICDGKEGDNAA